MAFSREPDVYGPKGTRPRLIALAARLPQPAAKGTGPCTPMKVDGNLGSVGTPSFHAVSWAPAQTLEYEESFPANNFKGDQLQARIRWKTANKLVE